MTRPDDPFEAASYDLNRFRERRMAERRATPRAGTDRRASPTQPENRQPPPEVLPDLPE